MLLTPNRWSPVPIVSSLVPSELHHRLIQKFSIDKNRLEEDVFPTHYLMNTRKELLALFCDAGFEEVDFAALPDCTVMQHYRATLALELTAYRILSLVGVPYPERNLLGVYRRCPDDVS